MDETYVVVERTRIAAVVADPARWRQWWPDLHLRVVEERGAQGIRWAVAGPLTGTMEIWLEPMLDGVLLHYFVHAEPAGASAHDLSRMNLAKTVHRRRVAGKKMSFEIKAELEATRPVGTAPQR